MNKKEFSLEFAGKTLTAEFSDLVEQANGSVLLKYGNTALLATAVMSDHHSGSDWFPLSVEYEERFYAAGKILGSQYTRREGRPSEEAILTGRIIDRTIRPLFDQRIRNSIQIVITILAIDEDDPDVLGVLASSIALSVSDIPFNGPVSAVRVGRQKGNGFVTNPTYDFRVHDEFDTDIIACGKDGNINMIEVGSEETTESDLMEGLEFAVGEIEKLQDFQKKIVSEIGKQKTEIELPEISSEIKELFAQTIEGKMPDYIMSSTPGKEKIQALKNEWKEIFMEKYPEEGVSDALEYYEERVDELIHNEAIDHGKRPDGRDCDTVRPLYAQAGGISPVLHGSGIFYRGGTHILSALTLGGPGDGQTIEGIEVAENKKYIHHYNFPPFSVGETGRVGGFNRRMIGHGALAEKALLPVLPNKDDFPYTIRIVSESMSSNGSTSMGSVCGSTIALMDAGVPIKKPVAGIASGLMMRDENSYKVLTDIQGPEDHHGDMDFKVAGTKDGVTAVQMDVKVDGIPLKILKEAFDKARDARLHILETITNEISEPRSDISSRAPKIVVVKIKQDQIGLVIGKGGETVNDIRDKTGADISIEDDGTVFITGADGGADKAAEIIKTLTKEFKVGERIDGATIVKVTDFGAFAKLNASTEALIHISEIAPFRVDRVEKYLKEGDKVNVIVKEIDAQKRLKLSIKDIEPDKFSKPEVSARPAPQQSAGHTPRPPHTK